MDTGPGRLPKGGGQWRAERRLALWGLNWALLSPTGLGNGAASAHSIAPSTWSSPDASLSPHLFCCKARSGSWGFCPRPLPASHILDTHMQSHRVTVTCTLWMEAHCSPVSPWPLYKHRHALPFTVPGLLSCPPPISCPPVRPGAEEGGGTGGRCQCPWSRRRTFLAWVRSHKLPPSRNLSRLSSRLTQCLRVGQLG